MNDTNSEPSPEQQPSQEDVAIRAWEIWEQEGRPEGRSAEHWNRAQEELRGGGSGSAEPAEEKRTPSGENL